MLTEDLKILVIRHEQCSGIGMLGYALNGNFTSLHYLDTPQGAVLTDAIETYSHIVVLGGAISPFEDDQYPFLRYEFQLLETAIAQGIPILGICLGSQILARILGARVYRGEFGREAGWCDLELTEHAITDPLLHNFPRQFKVFESHQDTFDLPLNCVHLVQSRQYRHQAFRFQDHVWAIQFHPEIDETVLADCAAVIEKELEGSNITDTTLGQLLAEASYHSPAVAPLAIELMQQFLQVRSRVQFSATV